MAPGSQQVEILLDARASTGESPVWSDAEGLLYWIDVEAPALHRLDPATGADESWETPSRIGAIALCESGAILLALRTGLAKMTIATGVFEQLCAPPYNPLNHRFNDGKCDARGRFWVGAKHEPLRGQKDGARAFPVSVFTPGAGLQQRDARAVIANGLAWSPDASVMYLSDSDAGVITAFDYDLGTGGLSAPRVFAQFDPARGTPDGATVDAEGFYWCALYGGGCVLRLAPDGRIDRRVDLPVSQPTMCAFGDADHETLYITSAAGGAGRETHAGAIFRCRPGVTGRPAALFADGG